METSSETPGPVKQQRLNLSIDLRLIIFLLCAVIAAMLILWRPWQYSAGSAARTISVTGDATLKATPDEYGFSPSYEFDNNDKAAAIQSAGDKQTELVAKLKTLGVSDNQIQTSIDGYQDYQPVVSSVSGTSSGSYTYSLRLNVTVPTRELAQKIQDYLATTSPSGQVTPNVQFSDATRKKLESQARASATHDARAKADQSAKNLGFRVGSVKSVDDGSGFGSGILSPLERGADLSLDSTTKASPSIAVQPGQNNLSYSVSVVYYIK